METKVSNSSAISAQTQAPNIISYKTYSPKLIFPTHPAKIEGASFLIPLQFSIDGKPDHTVNNWFRHLLVAGKVGESTVGAYAVTVNSYFKHIYEECSRKGWRESTISDIRIWRNADAAKGNRSKTTKSKLNCLFMLLRWAYVNKQFDKYVGTWKEECAEGGISPKNANLRVKKEPYLDPPSTKEIEQVAQMIAAHGKAHAARDMLIWRWAKEVGLRNSEILTLTRTSFPSWAKIATFREGVAKMKVNGKGGKIRTVLPPLSLLTDTREYFESDDYKASALDKNIFLSVHGRRLSQQWISKLFANFFALAGIDSHLHRARAYYLYQLTMRKVRELQATGKLDELHIATILRFVLDVAGHEELDTLRHYVNLAVMSLGVEVQQTAAQVPP
ncbi:MULTISPECIES: tyrosine-type recombinase/integrase [unclassified Roseateles]|uniref:tyrosine-type recombinase/integrase n=1 Tax=unclassified Roseateles TaxID=2626991 RepID=UPI0009EAAF14|nr:MULTISPECIES: tyrosine-type recombinase/integrase [unclassified Roseateles]